MINKYNIEIKAPEDFDVQGDEFKFLFEQVNDMINGLDDNVQVILARVPDDFNISQGGENYLKLLMTTTRTIIAEKYPDCFIFASQFDISCINKPDRIYQVDDLVGTEYTDETLTAKIDEIMQVACRPKIVLPGIVT